MYLCVCIYVCVCMCACMHVLTLIFCYPFYMYCILYKCMLVNMHY